jgi:hypothetical protein
MIDLTITHLQCAHCGRPVLQNELYADVSLGEYEVLCRKDFYSRYKNSISHYLNIVKSMIPDILSPEDFEKSRENGITICNNFSFMSTEYSFLSDEQKGKTKDAAYKQLKTAKFRNKFILITEKESEYIKDGEYFISFEFCVVFKSYLEYLEQSLYNNMYCEFIRYTNSIKDPETLN